MSLVQHDLYTEAMNSLAPLVCVIDGVILSLLLIAAIDHVIPSEASTISCQPDGSGGKQCSPFAAFPL